MVGSKSGRWVIKLLVAASIFFVTGELLARALDMVDRLNGYTRLLYTRGPSLDLPYLLRPGLSLTLFGTEVRINRFCMRGPDVAEEPVPGVHRVLVLGDSVVFGLGLPEEETVSALLARNLNSESESHYEVINGGVPGYDAVAAVRFLEAYGLKLGPRTVVVGTSLNDYDVSPVLSPLGILARKDLGDRQPALVDRSEFLLLLRWLAAYARGNLWYQAAGPLEARRDSSDLPRNLERLVESEHLRFYRQPEPRYWNRLRHAFADLRTLTDEHGIDLVVAIFPEQYQVGVAAPDLTPQERLLDVCRETQLHCLDLQPEFSSADGELFADVQHPNATGHAVAAAAIAETLSLSADDGAEHAAHRGDPT